MKTRDWLFWALSGIAASTVGAGLLQVVAPGFVLKMLSVENTRATRQLFAMVGMFMCLFGGACWQALFSRPPQPTVVFWGSAQKFGASLAVGIGVRKGVFAPVALLVAGFDLLSGLLGAWYGARLRKSE